MTQTITLLTKTAYFYGDVELWTSQRIAAEYGATKTGVRYWTTLPDFPAPFAVTSGTSTVKSFYRADEVQAWAATSKHVQRVGSDVRPGRPRHHEVDPRTQVEVVRTA